MIGAIIIIIIFIFKKIKLFVLIENRWEIRVKQNTQMLIAMKENEKNIQFTGDNYNPAENHNCQKRKVTNY